MSSFALTAPVSAGLGSALSSFLNLGGITNNITALAGSVVSQYLASQIFGSQRHLSTPRLQEIYIQGAASGRTIPIVWGRARLAGQIIWTAPFQENIHQQQQGGKASRPTVTINEYHYSLSFAVAICQGPINRLGQVWADSAPLDMGLYNWRLYKGDTEQSPDPLIEAIEGHGNVPAWHDIAYIVFEDFPLAEFGNRLPQFSCEVFRQPHPDSLPNTALEKITTGICMIPATGEFTLATTRITQTDSLTPRYLNAHTATGLSDYDVALDILQAELPICKNIALVVSWFGDDLRCGHCQIKPGVEDNEKTTIPLNWQVNGIERAQAQLLSEQQPGRIAYGGTPSDNTVVEAIENIKQRGLDVHFYPFLLMDIPAGNNKPDPYGHTEQKPYPWRGRITTSLASGGYHNLIHSSIFDHTDWKTLYVTLAPHAATAPDGSNQAATLTDSLTSNYGFSYQTLNINPSQQSYTTSLYIEKKPAGSASCNLRIRLYGQAEHYAEIVWDPHSGSSFVRTYQITPLDADVQDEGDFWHIWITLKNDGLQSKLRVMLYPTYGDGNNLSNIDPLQTGSITIWGCMINHGDITNYIAADGSGTDAIDGSAQAAQEVAHFFGTTIPTDFTIHGSEVTYNGPSEWSYRRHILHYAHLCAAVGGIKSFIIGSELRGLTRIRDHDGGYPAVQALKTLAQDVRQILGPEVKITYAADWTEYGSYVWPDGSDSLDFPLDDLWTDNAIDGIGLDWYAPLSDWRDGNTHLDKALSDSIYDMNYLQSQIESGEYYDWYYRNHNDQKAQIRTPITDSTYNEAWVFRVKDIRNWWQNLHYPRRDGIVQTQPTAWQIASKPLYFTEIGCPAVDKGSNSPNLFYDPKSSEHFLPPFSNGQSDITIQRRFIEAFLSYWQDDNHNPTSHITGQKMIGWHNAGFVWCWDARPFPQFPALSEVWGDSENWQYGHWLNGRVGMISLSALVNDALRLCHLPLDNVDMSQLEGMITGYVMEQPSSLRSLLEGLFLLTNSDIDNCQDNICLHSAAHRSLITDIKYSDLVSANDGSMITYERDMQNRPVNRLRLGFYDLQQDYQQNWLELSKPDTTQNNESLDLMLPLIASLPQMQEWGQNLLARLGWQRMNCQLTLPPSFITLDSGDIIALEDNNHNTTHLYQIQDIQDNTHRQIQAVRYHAPQISRQIPLTEQTPQTLSQRPPDFQILNLPLLSAEDKDFAPWIAANTVPWQGNLAVYRHMVGDQSGSMTFDQLITQPASIGHTITDFYPASPHRWDRGNQVWVKMTSGQLSSLSENDILNGHNSAALYNASKGIWEILQFTDAELVDTNTYRLHGFLRGQMGSEDAMDSPLPAGSIFVFLDQALQQSNLPDTLSGQSFRWHVGLANHALDSEFYAIQTADNQAIGRRPLPVVHIKRQWQSDGSAYISWIRQSRIPHWDWQQDTPLGEDRELYEVRVLDTNGQTIRTTQTTMPQWSYDTNKQQEDWGGLPPDGSRVEIVQIGSFMIGKEQEITLV